VAEVLDVRAEQVPTGAADGEVAAEAELAERAEPVDEQPPDSDAAAPQNAATVSQDVPPTTQPEVADEDVETEESEEWLPIDESEPLPNEIE
jgi:hypothetical protein